MHEPTSLRNRNLMLKPCRQRPGGDLWLFALCVGLATTAWAWPGHTWETWRDASTWTKPDLRTLQTGRKELVPLLATEADSNARIDGIRAWEHRRKDTGAVIQRILGKPTNLPAAPPEVEVLGEETLTDHIRRHIRIRCEADDWIPAYVLLPRKLPAPRVAAMICLHQTAASGKDEPCGINGDDDLALALQLVRRGYVCIAPDMIGFGERIPDGTQPYHDSIAFYRRHPSWSFMGKMVWDASRVVDYLETLPYVDPLRIGAIGHSHGAYGAVFAAAFEPRISLAIASCGFNTFRADPTPERWSHMTALIPQLGTYLPDVAAIPFDWHDIFAQIAPRPLYIWYATQDRIFPNTHGLDAVLKDVRTVYGLYGAADDLEWHAFDGPHSFLEPARTQAYAWLDARFAYEGATGGLPASARSGAIDGPEGVHTEQPAAASSSTAPLLNGSTALARRAPGGRPAGQRPEGLPVSSGVPLLSISATKDQREITQRIIRRTIGTPPPQPAPNITVIETTKLPNYERHLIEYNVEPGERVRAYLCVPNASQRPLPAVLVLHQTAAAGKREAVGLDGDGVYAFGADLAERGYITLSPDSICAGERIDAYGPFDTRGHYQRYPALSAMGRMLHDAQQALDVLAVTDGVDASRLGTIGHSLGAEEALMLAAFDERVRATVSSCGFATFAAEANPLRWARDQWFSYMPKLRPIFLTGRQPAWDWPDVIRLLAPRALFLHNTTEDAIFPEAESAHAAAEAARPLWARDGRADRLVSVLKPGGHTISAATKADMYAWLDRELKSATPATSRPADARHSTHIGPHREEH